MKKNILGFAFMAIAIGGCSVVSESIERAPAALPDEVVALAAPNQNIETARLSSDDNCYWYEHVGPVETTLIPLISLRGGPICLERTS